ncbi:MAG TPA: type I-B CRISPR-associated protein Cas5 [Persephonella sp.]|nr:type I-B CRISPR-associated protein Cas5 [Persephonella sp.]
MRVLVFDLTGYMAHFRTFYTNSSSVSYGFPPRTAIIGIIAGILGYERDTYYEVLSPENCKVSVAVINPVRKFLQTVNYVRTKPDDDNFKNLRNALRAYLERKINTYQVGIEFAVPLTDKLRYRVYFTSEDNKLYESLKKRLENGKTHYPVYLGLTELLADLEYVGEFPIEKPIENRGIRSVIPEEFFEKIDFSQSLSLLVERMPYHFKLEGNLRKLVKIKKFIYERVSREIPLTDYRGVVYIRGENIIWM